MFREGKIDEDTVDCPRFVAFKGASREDSSSSFNLGQLTKRIHGESDEFDEEEARQAQRKDRRRWAPFYLESPIGFTFTWNRPLCAVLMLLGGPGGGGGAYRKLTEIRYTWRQKHPQTSRPSASNLFLFRQVKALSSDKLILHVDNYELVSASAQQVPTVDDTYWHCVVDWNRKTSWRKWSSFLQQPL